MEILALLIEARCKRMEKTMIIKWKFKESETFIEIEKNKSKRKDRTNENV
jgi:hypothetical protein